MILFKLFFLGTSIGVVSAFFGIGGGAIIVPILYMIYPDLPPSVIIPISLGCIFLVTLLNSIQFYIKKMLPTGKTIINFGISCSIGALIGAQFLQYIEPQMAKFSIGIILGLMVVKTLFSKTKPHQDETPKEINSFLLATTGLFGSLISSLTGLGGGIIFTPVFLNILKIPPKRVSPLSNIAMLFATFMGVLPHFFTSSQSNVAIPYHDYLAGNVHLGFIALIFIGASTTSMLGVKLNSLVSDQSKRLLFAALLFIFSVKLLFF